MATDMNGLIEGVRDSVAAIAAIVHDRKDTAALDALHAEERALTEEVRSLKRTIEHVNHWRQVLLRGLLTGVATAIGATVVAAIVISVLMRVAETAGIDRFLPVVEQVKIGE